MNRPRKPQRRPHGSRSTNRKPKQRAREMDNGTQIDTKAGDVYLIPQGHDAWVVSSEPCVALDLG